MATFADMRTRITDDMANDGALSTAQIDKAIKSAIKFYERRAFWFNQKVDTFNTVAGQEYYAAAALADIPNIVQIYSATLNSGGIKRPLRDADFGAVDALQNGIFFAIPTHYTYFRKQIRLYAIPDGIYTVTLAYHYKPAELVNDTDENDWTNDAEELIRNAAKRRIAIDTLQSPELALTAAASEKEALDELLAETRRRTPQKYMTTNIPTLSSTFDINSGL